MTSSAYIYGVHKKEVNLKATLAATLARNYRILFELGGVRLDAGKLEAPLHEAIQRIPIDCNLRMIAAAIFQLAECGSQVFLISGAPRGFI